MVHTYDGMLFSHEKERNAFVITCMTLEHIMLSEVSHKDKYCVISLISEI